MVNPPAAGPAPASAPNPPSGGAAIASTSGVATAPNAPNAPNAHSGNFSSALGPGNEIYCERLVSDSTWTTSFLLSLSETNWPEWSRRLTLLCGTCSVSKYLTGTMVCPDPGLYPTAHHIWQNTDQSLRSFILTRVDRDEYDAVSGLNTAHGVYAALQTRHEKLGLHAQINLLRSVFDIQFDRNLPMEDTLRTVLDIYDRIIKMGPLDNDKLLFVILINCLERDFSQLQSDIHGMTDNPALTSADAVKRIRTEARLNKRRNELSPRAPTVALAATSADGKDPIACSNCKRLHHTIEFCVRRGGKMAGRSVDDARAAQRLAAGKPAIARPNTTTAGRGTSTASSALTAPPLEKTPFHCGRITARARKREEKTRRERETERSMTRREEKTGRREA